MPKDHADIPSTVENALARNQNWPIKPFEIWLPRIHASEVVVDNYINARAMRTLMEQKNGEYIQAGMENNSEEESEASRAFRCCALAFYFFATTALNAARQLTEDIIKEPQSEQTSKEYKELIDYRELHRKEATRINDTRNQVVSHPYQTKDAAYLSSWGSDNKIKAKVRTISKEGLSNEREITLDPKNDLLWLHSYLDGLFILINRFLPNK